MDLPALFVAQFYTELPAGHVCLITACLKYFNANLSSFISQNSEHSEIEHIEYSLILFMNFFYEMLSTTVVPSGWRWPDTRVYATDTGIRRSLEGKNHDSWIDSLISSTESVNINTRIRRVIRKRNSLTRFLCSSVARGSTVGLGARLDPGVSPTSPLILTQKK